MTAAYHLQKRGIPSVVIDPEPVLGGLLRTEQIEGCTVETGSDSWLAQKPWARELAGLVGLADDVIGSNDAQRGVQVLRRGKLVPFPSGMQLIVPKRLSTVWTSPLFGLGTKLRMTADWYRQPSGSRPERSVAQLVREHFGQGAVDYLAEPLLTGIYGGHPEDLSATSVLPRLVEREEREGSLTRTASREPDAKSPVFASMRKGLGQLPAALEPRQRIKGTAETVERTGSRWRIRVDGVWLDASSLIIATPAHATARILAAAAPELGALLAAIRHSSANIVAMGFRGLPSLPGFGLLVPRIEGHNLMAATFVTTKFAGRAPSDIQVVRAFFRKPSPDPLAELRTVAAIGQQPVFTRAYHWPNSLPQYAVGHRSRIVQVERLAAALPGLKLIGNAYHGVGIPDCIRLATETAAAFTPSAQVWR